MTSRHRTFSGKFLRYVLGEACNRIPMVSPVRGEKDGCDDFLHGVSFPQGVELDQQSIERAVEGFVGNASNDSETYSINPVVGSCNESATSFDRVIRQAIRDGICPEWLITDCGREGRITWRMVAEMHPELSAPLYRLAAITYGFHPITICEVSTLVQADLLSTMLEPLEWQKCFELGLVPVVEHGLALHVQPGEKIAFAAWDPCNRPNREFVSDLKAVRGTLRFAPRPVVESLQALVVQSIPDIAGSAPAGTTTSQSVLRMVVTAGTAEPEYSRAA